MIIFNGQLYESLTHWLHPHEGVVPPRLVESLKSPLDGSLHIIIRGVCVCVWGGGVHYCIGV